MAVFGRWKVEDVGEMSVAVLGYRLEHQYIQIVFGVVDDHMGIWGGDVRILDFLEWRCAMCFVLS